jgi:hypothetical protein
LYERGVFVEIGASPFAGLHRVLGALATWGKTKAPRDVAEGFVML